MVRILHQLFFVVRVRYMNRSASYVRKFWYGLFGMRIGKHTFLPKVIVTWPHQVRIGNHCQLEKDIFFKFDGVWKPGPSIEIGNHVFIGRGCEFNIRKKVFIGNDCLIASGCKFIDHDHGTSKALLMRIQEGVEEAIKIGNNAWLGCNVITLKGVEVGDGAIVAAGAVITKSIPANEIWAGVPARKIGER